MPLPDKGPYSRVYHSLIDDPDFDGVYENDRLFAMWTRMLMDADAFWPNSAPMPRRSPALASLIEKGIVIPLRGNRYTIKGLSAERERRSASARNAAAVRWQNARSAVEMPRRDETRRDENTASHTNGARPTSAATATIPRAKGHSGQHEGCTVCDAARSAGSIDEQMDDQWRKCKRCGQRKGGPAHAPGADHEFAAA